MDCNNCGEVLHKVFESEDTEYQYDNALWLVAFGGYGMFIDNDNGELGLNSLAECDGSASAVICHECAHSLCEAFPWVNELLNPQNSHSHTIDYWTANPEHEGWDK